MSNDQSQSPDERTTAVRRATYNMVVLWWWCVPYSIVGPVFSELFGLGKYAHNAMELPYFYLFLAWIASILWTIVALFRLAVTRRIASTGKMKLMILASAIAGALWPAMDWLIGSFK